MTLDDVRQMGIILGRNALESAPASKAVSYTHLTLPTTPYV